MSGFGNAFGSQGSFPGWEGSNNQPNGSLSNGSLSNGSLSNGSFANSSWGANVNQYNGAPTWGGGTHIQGGNGFGADSSFAGHNGDNNGAFGGGAAFGGAGFGTGSGFGGVFGAVAAISKRPADSDPFGLITWVLETSQTGNHSVSLPGLRFEIHQYEFCPQHQPPGSTPVRVPVVSLSFIAASDYGEVGVRRRFAVIRHTVQEVLRIKKHLCVFVHRVNDELTHPAANATYQVVVRELNRLQPKIKPIHVDTKQLALHITFPEHP